MKRINNITQAKRRFLVRISYFCGHYISYPMLFFDLDWLYPIYNRLMALSSDYDIEGLFWEKPCNHMNKLFKGSCICKDCGCVIERE